MSETPRSDWTSSTEYDVLVNDENLAHCAKPVVEMEFSWYYVTKMKNILKRPNVALKFHSTNSAPHLRAALTFQDLCPVVSWILVISCPSIDIIRKQQRPKKAWIDYCPIGCRMGVFTVVV
ncbi:hypothetical protein ABEB36_001989 [Hypothenemus hampei]|uniref:Uncharacterized protein n=1 Tax=Hypothenemus hampei TaxID=57062 RepID=A0ABD1FGH0_HYPHA